MREATGRTGCARNQRAGGVDVATTLTDARKRASVGLRATPHSSAPRNWNCNGPKRRPHNYKRPMQLTCWIRLPFLSQWMVGGGDEPASHSIVMLAPSAAENSLGGSRRNLTWFWLIGLASALMGAADSSDEIKRVAEMRSDEVTISADDDMFARFWLMLGMALGRFFKDFRLSAAESSGAGRSACFACLLALWGCPRNQEAPL